MFFAIVKPSTDEPCFATLSKTTFFNERSPQRTEYARWFGRRSAPSVITRELCALKRQKKVEVVDPLESREPDRGVWIGEGDGEVEYQ